jgi:lactoylglutathione lyase
MTMSIGNVAVWVSDLERAKRFYCEGLGLDVLAKMQTPEVHEVVVGRQGFGSQLMLAHRVDHEGEVAPSGFWKTFLFSDDLIGDVAKAVAAGATVVTEPTFVDQFRITIAILADLDGYLLELGQLDQAEPS